MSEQFAMMTNAAKQWNEEEIEYKHRSFVTVEHLSMTCSLPGLHLVTQQVPTFTSQEGLFGINETVSLMLSFHDCDSR